MHFFVIVYKTVQLMAVIFTNSIVHLISLLSSNLCGLFMSNLLNSAVPFLQVRINCNIGGINILSSLISFRICVIHAFGIAFLIPKYVVNMIVSPRRISSSCFESISPSWLMMSCMNNIFFVYIFALKGMLIAGFPHKGSNCIGISKFAIAVGYHFW